MVRDLRKGSEKTKKKGKRGLAPQKRTEGRKGEHGRRFKGTKRKP